MGVTRPTYTTREDVKSALDIRVTARDDSQVDDAIESAAELVDGALLRPFYPQLATRRFDWPNHQYARPWRLWLDGNELISVTTLTAGGVVVASTDYLLRRADDVDEPPYDQIQIDLSSTAAFQSGSTHQEAIVILGLWSGCPNNEAAAGALAEDLDTTETEVDVTNSAALGVGDVGRVDSERFIVADKAMITTGQTLATGLTTALANDVAGTVADNSGLHVGEVLLMDAERMLLVEKTGSTGIIVKRAVDGSVLAAHTTPTIFAPRRLTVVRPALGTTAAAHTNGAALTRYVAPAGVRALARAEAINIFQQEQASWGRTVGSGDNEREAAGTGLADIRQRAMTRYGRQARVGAL